MLGYKHTKESRLKISLAKKGKPSPRRGIKHTEETKKKMILNHKGRTGKKNSKEHKRKIGEANTGKHRSKETLKKLSISHIGKNIGSDNPSWKGGITPKNKKIRNSIELRLWRESVFARDNWTCQKTKIKGGKLHAHHILNFYQYPELRTDIDNGIILSEKSHREFHKKYNKFNNTKEQLIEFLNQ